MTVIEALKLLLACEMADGSSVSDAIVKEKDPNAKLKRLTFSELRPGMLALMIDAGRATDIRGRPTLACMSPLFKATGEYDHNCACDAVIVRERADAACDIAYIDLKSDSPTGYSGQFKSTRCFLIYIAALLNNLYDVPMRIEWERFIICHTDPNNAKSSLGKRPTRPKPSEKNSPNTPKKYIVLNEGSVRCTEIFRS